MEWLPCQAAKLATTTLQGLIMKLWWSSASLNTQSDHSLSHSRPSHNALERARMARSFAWDQLEKRLSFKDLEKLGVWSPTNYDNDEWRFPLKLYKDDSGSKYHQLYCFCLLKRADHLWVKFNQTRAMTWRLKESCTMCQQNISICQNGSINQISTF